MVLLFARGLRYGSLIPNSSKQPADAYFRGASHGSSEGSSLQPSRSFSARLHAGQLVKRYHKSCAPTRDSPVNPALPEMTRIATDHVGDETKGSRRVELRLDILAFVQGIPCPLKFCRQTRIRFRAVAQTIERLTPSSNRSCEPIRSDSSKNMSWPPFPSSSSIT